MKNKNLLKSSLMILLMFFGFANMWGQTTLAGWNANGLSGYGPSPWAASTTATGVSVSQGVTRGSGILTGGTAAGSCWGGSGGWQTSSTPSNDSGSVTFSVTVADGYQMSLSSLTSRTRRSNSGPSSNVVTVSVNGGAFINLGSWSTTTTSGTTGTSNSTNLANQSTLQSLPAGTVVKFRITGFSTNGGNWYFTGSAEALKLNGTVTLAQSPCTDPSGFIAEDIQEVNIPNTATFSISDAADYTSIQWERSTNGGTAWSDISGATGISYTTESTTLAMDGYMYRAELTNAPGGCTSSSFTTNEAILFVSELLIAPELEDANIQATVGTSVSYQIVNNGGTADLYEVVAGELPTGLNLNPTSGLISGTPTIAGDFGAQINAENGEGIGSAWLDFSISQGIQTVTGLTDLSKNINEEPFTLPLTTNAGLTLSYESSNTSVATVSGNTITLEGLGSTIITATQAGNENWNPFTQEITLTVVDGPCGTETFENVGAPASAYITRTWTGNGGIDWQATQARTDRTDIDGSQTIGMRAVGTGSTAGEVGELTNTTAIAGGIGNLTFQYARIFSGGAPVIQVFVNGVQYGGDIVAPTGNPNPIAEFNEIINVAEDATILIKILSTENDRVVIDNLSWTCYSAPEEIITWTTEGEWSNGTGPTSTSDNVIIEGTLITSGDLSANNLTVVDGGSLTISTGNALTLAGALVNEGGLEGFVVESGANLIQTSDAINTGDISVYQNSASMMRNEMALWSSPVSGQGIRAFSTETLYNRFWTYDESNSMYTPLFTADTDEMDFAQGAGYAIRVRNTLPTGQSEVKQGEFTGVPFNGTVTVPVSFNQNGYNIVGNPYPSNIDAQEFLAVNNNVEAVYFWNRQYPIGSENYDNNYATFSIAGGNFGDLDFISKAQGFILKVSAAGNVTFNNAMRTADNAIFYKGGNEIEKHRIWISLSDESQKLSQILLAYMTGASEEFDNQIDAKLFGNGAALLYNLIDGDKYAIQGRSLPFETTDVVALGFSAAETGIYTIALENVDGLFAEGQVVYIRDLQKELVHNLSETAYTFEAEAGEFNNRFEVIYEQEDAMGTDDLLSGSVQVYKHNDNIVIASKSENILSVELYDLNGRKLHENQNVNARLYQVISASKGILVVKVQTEKGEILTKKVVSK